MTAPRARRFPDACRFSEPARPFEAFGALLNQDKWADTTWRAMGAGIVDSHAAVWFGKDADPMP
ncbi:MAG: hypothetical protein HY908_24160 [Myxococcales bacterium]|nr:hypothetical protein [Myxococcales bacterium]